MKDLFEYNIQVRPTESHPCFGTIKFGMLSVFVFADDPDMAAATGGAIVDELPYKFGRWAVYRILKDGVPESGVEPYQVDSSVNALQIGISFVLHSWPMDADEEYVMGDWPFLLPIIQAP